MLAPTLEKYRAQARAVGCTRYNPCPICYRCTAKASHLHLQCAQCEVPFCGRHTEKIRGQMIQRESITIIPESEVKISE